MRKLWITAAALVTVICSSEASALNSYSKHSSFKEFSSIQTELWDERPMFNLHRRHYRRRHGHKYL